MTDMVFMMGKIWLGAFTLLILLVYFLHVFNEHDD
jgi:hypothetical protein